MINQITDTLLMIRPVAFHRNEETAVNNYYQKKLEGINPELIQKQALEEFDAFVHKLREEGVNVLVFEDTLQPETPDSIFPNNWVSFHEDGAVILYPMYAENRRKERRRDLLDDLEKKFRISVVEGFTAWEAKGRYLEGTGSIILDRQHKMAYAAISERTNPEVLKDFGEKTGYDIISFSAFQTVGDKRLPIYHTNVMMCLGESFAVICAESIDNEIEKKQIMHALESTKKEVIFITESQKERFAGNMLQVMNNKGERLIVMSDAAFLSLEEEQVLQLRKHGKLIHSSLNTIERLGGGSARCMMAEVFLPKK